jgi:hypothetical protein
MVAGTAGWMPGATLASMQALTRERMLARLAAPTPAPTVA